MEITTESGQITLQQAASDIIESLAMNWPLGLKADSQRQNFGLVVQRNKQEVWGVALRLWKQLDSSNLKEFIQIERILIPYVMNKLRSEFSGCFMAGPYYRNDHGMLDHGIAIYHFPGNREDIIDAGLPKDYTERDKVWEKMISHPEWSSVMAFFKVYCNLFQDITGIRFLLDAPKMLPSQMMENHFTDFIISEGKLICLKENPDSDDLAWNLLAAEKVETISHLPTRFIADIDDPSLKLNPEGFYVTTEALISESRNYTEIVVPDLVGSVVDDWFSVGWDGCVTLQPIGLDRVIRIDPHGLKQLERQPMSEDKCRNRQIWKQRAAIAQKILGWRELVTVKDDIRPYQEILVEFEKALRALQRDSARNANLTMIKGDKKAIKRYLEGLIDTPVGEKAQQALNILKSATTAEEALYTVESIIKSFGFGLNPKKTRKKNFPPTGGPVPFINDTHLRRPKLLFLYELVSKIRLAKIYSRAEIEEIVCAELGDIDSQSLDTRFSPDVIIRNLVDVGYLDRDPHKNEYWLIARS